MGRRQRQGKSRREHRNRHRRDFISDLPDHLLHRILDCLKSIPAAARTSVLSRRWRHVWEDLPDLVFGNQEDDSDAITPALESYYAPTVCSLHICVGRCMDLLPDGSLDAWMHFASQRLTGTFRLAAYRDYSFAEIDLPPFERATSIDIDTFPLYKGDSLLRFRSAGTFAALTKLKIETTFMEAKELEALVSLHCPRLTDLSVITRVCSSFPREDAVLDVFISSSSLNRLNIDLANVQRLHVATPKLRVLTSGTKYDAAFISAPVLAEVGVSCLHLYQFSDVGRHLRWLYMDESSVMQTRWFHAVDELSLRVDHGHDENNRFLDDINIPKCEILRVSLGWYDHGFVPCVLQILRKANGTRKFVMDRCSFWTDTRCSLTCPCRSPETSNADDVTFASLEEIEVDRFYGGDDRLEFLELLLSSCSAPKLTSLRIIMEYSCAPVPSKKEVENLINMCPPNVRLTIINS